MALKVIGAGFGRTGTLSLKAALEDLGFGRCYHMMEVLKKPHQIMQGGRADWETLFKGYQAATDWPVAAYYRDLMSVYPAATARPTPRAWRTSRGSLRRPPRQADRRFSHFT